jgi:hypothetical protein
VPDRHLVEDLASLVEALAALGRDEELEITRQRLITVAEQVHAEDVAADGLAQAAARILARDGDRAAAAYMFATAIVISLAGVASADLSDEAKAQAYTRAFVQPLGHLVGSARATLGDDASPFYRLVLKQLTNKYRRVGRMLRPYVKELIDAATATSAK